MERLLIPRRRQIHIAPLQPLRVRESRQTTLVLYNPVTGAIIQTLVVRRIVSVIPESSLVRTLEQAALLRLVKSMVLVRTAEHDRLRNAQLAQTVRVQLPIGRIFGVLVDVLAAIDLRAIVAAQTATTLRRRIVDKADGTFVDERLAAGAGAEVVLRTVEGV